MTWRPGWPKNFQGEVAKIRWEVLPYTQGAGLDIGCGRWKLWPSSIGVDRGPGTAANLAGDVSDLTLTAGGCMDYVFSAHCLEHVADYRAALAEWWRVLKVGGHLALYLPHKNFYPNIGTDGANPDHKHDFLPADISRAMSSIAPDRTLVDDQARNAGDEYSFLQVYRKEALGAGAKIESQECDPAKRCIVLRYGGFGDVLVASSTFPHLKAEGWHVTVYTSPGSAALLEHDPHVDRVIAHDIAGWSAGDLAQLAHYLRGRCARFVNFCETFEGLFLADPRRPSYYWPHRMRHRYMNGSYLEAAHEAAGVPQVYRQRFYDTRAEHDQAWIWRAGMQRLVVLAASGTGVNKVWPGMLNYASLLVARNPELHVAVFGDLRGYEFAEHPRVHVLGESLPMRQACALAKSADLVIGQETGLLNAVAFERMPKIVLLSHSSPENLTAHWVNTQTLNGDAPCWPCHRLHADWKGCTRDAKTGAAACQAAIDPQRALELTESLLGLREQLDLAA